MSLYNTQITTIDGQQQTLGDYAGKVLLVVNVASQCGLTPQYEQLEKLYQDKKDEGLVVLGFPCNQFRGQEPGSDEEIQAFCRSNYGVQFPLFSKIEVNGDGRHPLYRELISAQPESREQADSPLLAKLSEHGLLGDNPSDISWNFEKFLIDRNGAVVARFAPDMTVDLAEISDSIDRALAS